MHSKNIYSHRHCQMENNDRFPMHNWKVQAKLMLGYIIQGMNRLLTQRIRDWIRQSVIDRLIDLLAYRIDLCVGQPAWSKVKQSIASDFRHWYSPRSRIDTRIGMFKPKNASYTDEAHIVWPSMTHVTHNSPAKHHHCLPYTATCTTVKNFRGTDSDLFRSKWLKWAT